MSVRRKTYRLERRSRLLLLRAAVGGSNGQASVLRLLLDTGSSYTMLPVEVLEALGYDIHHFLVFGKKIKSLAYLSHQSGLVATRIEQCR